MAKEFTPAQLRAQKIFAERYGGKKARSNKRTRRNMATPSKKAAKRAYKATAAAGKSPEEIRKTAEAAAKLAAKEVKTEIKKTVSALQSAADKKAAKERPVSKRKKKTGGRKAASKRRAAPKRAARKVARKVAPKRAARKAAPKRAARKAARRARALSPQSKLRRELDAYIKNLRAGMKKDRTHAGPRKGKRKYHSPEWYLQKAKMTKARTGRRLAGKQFGGKPITGELRRKAEAADLFAVRGNPMQWEVLKKWGLYGAIATGGSMALWAGWKYGAGVLAAKTTSPTVAKLLPYVPAAMSLVSGVGLGLYLLTTRHSAFAPFAAIAGMVASSYSMAAAKVLPVKDAAGATIAFASLGQKLGLPVGDYVSVGEYTVGEYTVGEYAVGGQSLDDGGYIAVGELLEDTAGNQLIVEGVDDMSGSLRGNSLEPLGAMPTRRMLPPASASPAQLMAAQPAPKFAAMGPKPPRIVPTEIAEMAAPSRRHMPSGRHMTRRDQLDDDIDLFAEGSLKGSSLD